MLDLISLATLPAPPIALTPTPSAAPLAQAIAPTPAPSVVQSAIAPPETVAPAARSDAPTPLVPTLSVPLSVPSIPSMVAASDAIAPVAPLSNFVAPPTSETDRAIVAQRQFLAARLSELVAKERPAKIARLRENLKAAAKEYARQGKFQQARQVIQDGSVPLEEQSAILREITAIETNEIRSVTEPDRSPLPSQTIARQPSRSQQFPQPLRSVLPVQPPIRTIEPGSIELGSSSGAGLPNVLPQNSLPRDSLSKVLPPLLPNGAPSLLFPLAMPAPITSAFGWRVHPVTGVRRFHSGTDIGAATGTPVLAAYPGKVLTADRMGGYGLAVVLEHNNGSQDTLYAHLSEILVRPGDRVAQGSVIGRVGSTGMSTGPHLHFEMRQKTANGMVTIDPGASVQAALNQLVRSRQTAQNQP